MDPIGVKDKLRHLLRIPREDLRHVDAVPVPAAMAAATENAASTRHNLRALQVVVYAISGSMRDPSGVEDELEGN